MQFNEKIKCIYEYIANNNLEELTYLFYNPQGKTSVDNRKLFIKRRWLDDVDIKPKKFEKEFSNYKISQLKIGGIPLFKSAQEFLEMDLKEFCQKIKSYYEDIYLDNSLPFIEYKYLYSYTKNSKIENRNIDYYEIDYKHKKSLNEIYIDVKAPKNRVDIENYEGILYFRNNKLIFNFQNSYDNFIAIFNLELQNKNTLYLVGVAIGIADENQKLPIAKKVFLTKHKLSEDELKEAYLIANESEVLLANENSFKIYSIKKDYKLENYFNNFVQKIDDLNTLFHNLTQFEYFNSVYFKLAFNSFNSIDKIFKKVKNNRSYYKTDRIRILKTILDNYKYYKYNTLNLVMPIYEENIFEFQSSIILDIINSLLELSKKVKIEIIFIIDSQESEFNYEFNNFLDLAKDKINIYFVLKDSVIMEVNSIDFIYTDKKDFVITKFLRSSEPVFHIRLDIGSINEYEAFFRKIKNRSITLQDYLVNPSKIYNSKNPILKKLIGEWNFYFYSSIKKLNKSKIKIYPNAKVEEYVNSEIENIGKIYFKSYQCYMVLENIINKRLFIVMFDNFLHKLNDAFIVKFIAKQAKKEENILAIGIFSKKEISNENIEYILGSSNEVQLIENKDIYDRLLNNNYLQ